ncbi:MAG: hypothetical protein II822_11165 [Prevotella sp.]|nr:hypothetical protein [Prevotella sp.]
MKKIEYQAPEMEVIEMMIEQPLLDASGEHAGGTGTGHAPELGEFDE